MSRSSTGRQHHSKNRALTQLALDCNLSIHPFNDVLHDGKTQAGSTHLAGASFIHPIESLENSGQILKRNAYAGIGNLDEGAAFRSKSAIRPNLAAIAGYAETLLDGALGDPQNNRKFVQIIQSSAIRLNSIASDLLVLSELEAGVNPGGPGRISVQVTLEDALATVEAEARTRSVSVIRGASGYSADRRERRPAASRRNRR